MSVPFIRIEDSSRPLGNIYCSYGRRFEKMARRGCINARARKKKREIEIREVRSRRPWIGTNRVCRTNRRAPNGQRDWTANREAVWRLWLPIVRLIRYSIICGRGGGGPGRFVRRTFQLGTHGQSPSRFNRDRPMVSRCRGLVSARRSFFFGWSFCRANELGVSQPINNIWLRDQLRALMRPRVKV